MALFYFLIILAFSTIAGLLIYFSGRKAIRRRKEDLSKAVLLRIQVPRHETGKLDFKSEAKKFEALLKRLASFNRVCSLEVFVEHIGGDIHFLLWVPRAFIGGVREEVYRLWHGAKVSVVHSAPVIFGSRSVSICGHIEQKKDHALSVKTHKVLEADPFASILKTLSRIEKIGEGAGMQLLLRPVSDRHKRSIAQSLTSMMRGELGEIVARNKLISKEGINIPSVGVEIEEKKKREKIKKDVFNFAWNKISQPLFVANVRICVSAGAKFRAEEILDEIVSSFSHFDDPHHNEFRFVKERNSEKSIGDFIARRWNDAETIVLSGEEIASFCHFASPPEGGMSLSWLGVRQIPSSGASSRGAHIGENEFEGASRQIFLREEDKQKHVFIAGVDGTGKSTLIGTMMMDDINHGRGAALIDPVGHLAERLLGKIPPMRRKDVIYLDVADNARPPGITLFDEGITHEEKVFMAEELCEITKKFFTLETRGPLFDAYIRNSFLLLAENVAHGANFFDLPRILLEKRYRALLLSRAKDVGRIRFWNDEARSESGETALAGIAPYILSRFEKFVASDFLRYVFAHPGGAVNIRRAVSENKIILVNLREKVLGRHESELLGMVLAGKIYAAAFSRSAAVETKKNYNLYLDDFGGCITNSFSSIISGDQNVSLNIVLATKSIGELPEKVRNSIFKSHVSRIIFRVTGQDAEYCASELGSAATRHDLINIPNFEACVKVSAHGGHSKPYTIRMKGDSGMGSTEVAHALKEHSRVAYGRDVRELEKEIRRKTAE